MSNFKYSSPFESTIPEPQDAQYREALMSKLQQMSRNNGWQELISDYLGMDSYYYDSRNDKILAHNNITGNIVQYHRGSRIFEHLRKLNPQIISDKHLNHHQIWDF